MGSLTSRRRQSHPHHPAPSKRASLPETMKRAPHTDVKMTMKYTHIRIDDRSKAVQEVPRQWNGNVSGVSLGLSMTSPVASCHEDIEVQKRQSPATKRGIVTESPSASLNDAPDGQWRRRESTRGLSNGALENASEAFIDKPHLGMFVDSNNHARHF